MTKTHVRWLVAVVAAFGVTFWLSASAFASFSPSFSVSTDEQGTTTISYQQSASDDSPGMLTFYVPADVFANVSQPGGQPVGTASGTVGGAAVKGTIAASLPTDTAPGGSAPFSTAVAACNPGIPEAPAAFWTVSLGSVSLPVYLFNVLETDPYGSFFIGALAICPPAGTKITQLTMKVDEVFSVTPTWDLWHLAAIPSASGAATLNTAGKVEAEAQDRTPHEVDATAKQGKAARTVLVTGKIKQGGVGLVGMTVNVLAGKKVVGTGKTVTGGRYAIVAKTAAKSVVATVTVPDRPLKSCVQPLFAPAPCVTSTISGFTADSGPVPVS